MIQEWRDRSSSSGARAPRKGPQGAASPAQPEKRRGARAGRLTGRYRTAAAILARGAARSASAQASRCSRVRGSGFTPGRRSGVRCPASIHGTPQASETRLSPKEQVKPYYLDLLVTDPFSVVSRSSFLGDSKLGGGDGPSSVTVFCCVWVWS